MALLSVTAYGLSQDDARVLAHFYTFEHFMEPDLDKYVKRFVRNYIHYRDEVRRTTAPWP